MFKEKDKKAGTFQSDRRKWIALTPAESKKRFQRRKQYEVLNK